MNTQNKHYDVVIVGAGMVGSALACALGGSNLSVALIEAQAVISEWPTPTADVTGFDPRVSAITLASQSFLTRIGVWPAIQTQRVSAYQHMHVWDAEGTGSIEFHADEINQPALGHIVENRITATALMQSLRSYSNIDLLSGASVTDISETGDSVHAVTLDSGSTLTASLVVGADGANSKIRAMAEIPMREWDYNHHAIVATVKTEKPHGNTARQRFLPEGPLAFLPLTMAGDDQHFCSIVWSAIPQYAENLMALDDGGFQQALADAFEQQLGAIAGVSQRFSFPLRQRHAVDYVKSGLALVGDAAHTIHPLAGQGVNLGLADVQVLSEELLRADHRDIELGSLAVLNRYQRRRKGANLAMMAGMEGFKRLFGNRALAVRWARNSGMRWMDQNRVLKHKVMRQAMGIA